MHLPVIPRRVKIGDAAAFAGTTPRAIRHYHAIGLLPEPERGADDRRCYGYDDMIRLLWIRKMADVGIALEGIRTTFEPGTDIEQSLARLEESLAAQAAVIERQRAAVRNWRESGDPLGLLSPLVTGRVRHLPPNSLRRSDLDTLLVTERIFGPLGAALQADRFIVLAAHPELRAEDDRLTEAETALDDCVDPGDPRVEEIAEQWCAHELAVESAIEEAGLDDTLDELAVHQPDQATDPEDGEPVMSAIQAIGKMPYDFSPARLRCMERAAELLNAARQTD
ncbi:MerR family transcriptional regulator [Streptomyces sp. AD681]|uniref:MerR family transcriptional regulator n=1 Tax=Streptomyces sp. AD681 TaxID=3019069 RepID=UPI0022F1909A|nr:MerR family transcriptional regulator [Streptomyces sp. AD681]MDA5146285.1 MerR family transcriptional regulator [Streptomyces sp. AD681]